MREAVARRLIELDDPRLELVTVTSATITPDLGEARVYWCVSGEAARIAAAEQGLAAACGVFRRVLAEDLGLRAAPRVRFFYDERLDRARAVEELLQRVRDADGGGSG